MDIKKNSSVSAHQHHVVNRIARSHSEHKVAPSARRRGFGYQRRWRIFMVLIFILIVLVVVTFFIRGKLRQKNYEDGLKNLSEGRFDMATENLKKVSSGENELDALYKLAVSKYNQKDFEGAIAGYTSVIEKDPQNYLAYNGLGNVYRDQKSYSQAQENYQKAFQNNPSFVSAYANLAIMQSDMGKGDEVRETIEDGLRNNPDNKELNNLKSILLEE
jgi:tetratricopeptide (TPR) repeat protein